MKPVSVQRLAENDLFDAIDYSTLNAPHVVPRFLLAVDRTMNSIRRSPRVGSPAFAEILDVPGLRFQTIKAFPYAFFYREHENEVRVIRVLHHGRHAMNLIGASDDE